MSDKSWQTQSKTESAVLDMNMEDTDDGRSDVSDYDTSFHADDNSQRSRSGAAGTVMEDLKQKMSENVTQMVWQAGTQGAKRAWSLYGNIDILRPYFDVEPREVQKRLIYSLIPSRPTDQRQQVPKELYGPTMVVLTLIAVLLYQMKTADHKVEEGTLMGSAFGVCFMYWLGVSCVVWFVAYVCNVRIVFLQTLSMMGYGLFGHCIVLFLGTVIHTSHDHMFFYFLWAVIGGLSTLRMAGIIMSRTRGKTERLFVIGIIAVVHLLFLLYLHFAYHMIVEEISDVLRANIVPVPVSAPGVHEFVGNDGIESPAEEAVKMQVLDVHTTNSLGAKDLIVRTTVKISENLVKSVSLNLPDSDVALFSDAGAKLNLSKLSNSRTIVA